MSCETGKSRPALLLFDTAADALENGELGPVPFEAEHHPRGRVFLRCDAVVGAFDQVGDLPAPFEHRRRGYRI
jgi:hypothetical protein